MTESKAFKRRVRERMSKTDESYTAARSRVSQKRDRVTAARTRLTAAQERPPDAKVKEASGKKWEQWFNLLDRWGGREKKHRDIARYLIDEFEVPGWWAQSITVYYERARKNRLKYQTEDGFSISATKTIGVPVDVLYDAFMNPRVRRRWLTDGKMSVRTSQPEKTARFKWDDGSTRVVVGFIDKGRSKSTVSLAHEKLPDAEEAENAKAMWKERLGDLKAFLESK